MSQAVRNVLFVCKANSARSIIAESLLREMGGDRFHAFSAGTRPAPEVHPLTLATLRDLRMPLDGLRSKSWREFDAPDTPSFDFVFTLCDEAANDPEPHWPGQPMVAHWAEPDPVAVEGEPRDKKKAFGDAAIILKRRIELMLSLPIESLDSRVVQNQLQRIGTA